MWDVYHRSKRAQLSALVGGFDHDVLDTFYSLTPDQLERLFNIYSDVYGDGPAEYARKTFADWRSGATRPSAQTINRLLDNLPHVLNFDGKCDLLGKLRERHRKPESHLIKVKADEWRDQVVPLVRTIITKAYHANLPEAVEQRLTWLSSGDMQAARALLSHSQAIEGAVAVRLLQDEMLNIDAALANLQGRKKVTHTIPLPYGNIHLSISRKRTMSKNDERTDLVKPSQSGLFKPNAEDIFDDVFSNLDEDQAQQVKARAAQEAMRIIAEKKRGEVKFENASRDIANFVHNADLMEERKKDYQMSGQFESASGVTKIQVGRNWSTTLIAGAAVAILLIIILLYVFNNLL
jgi:hypothetical protein